MTERYAALLRGVSPLNCKMGELAAAFEQAGFDDVKTVLSSGNVLFSAPSASEASLEKRCEQAMAKHLGRTFFTMVRPVPALRALLESDPWASWKLPAGSKRVVSFMRAVVKPKVALPHGRDGATVHALLGREVFSAYVKSPKGPVFMVLLEKAFGDVITTRTWETVEKLAR